MNIDCEKIIDDLDGSEDEFISYFQKILIMRVIQQIFYEMLICGRKLVYTDSFFEATNIMKNVQNYSSEFDGLFHKMASKEPFINQKISYINRKSEIKISIVSNDIKEFLSII